MGNKWFSLNAFWIKSRKTCYLGNYLSEKVKVLCTAAELSYSFVPCTYITFVQYISSCIHYTVIHLMKQMLWQALWWLSLVIKALCYADDGWLPSSVLSCIAELIISYYTHHTAVAITSVYSWDMKKLCNYTSMKIFCFEFCEQLKRSCKSVGCFFKNICMDDCSWKGILR